MGPPPNPAALPASPPTITTSPPIPPAGLSPPDGKLPVVPPPDPLGGTPADPLGGAPPGNPPPGISKLGVLFGSGVPRDTILPPIDCIRSIISVEVRFIALIAST